MNAFAISVRSHIKLGSRNEEGNKIQLVMLFELQRELSEVMKQKIQAEYKAIGGSPDKPLQSNYFLNIMITIAVLAFLASLLGNYVCF